MMVWLMVAVMADMMVYLMVVERAVMKAVEMVDL
jgi:hypothetical protein